MRDAAVIGSGPNGLAAAVILARAGLSVQVIEAETTLGGGARTLDLGLAPGVTHDICSAVHPMAVASPFFRAFDLPGRGVRLLHPQIAYAQPLDRARAALAWRDLDRTATALGPDAGLWRRLLGPLAAHPDDLVDAALGDRDRLPRKLGAALAFGARVVAQGGPWWSVPFRTDAAPALLTGAIMHAITPMPRLSAAGAGLLLAGLAHAGGWPIPAGGSQAITDAMVADLRAHGAQLDAGRPVRSFTDLPPARSYLFDTTPRALADILGGLLPARQARVLRRFRYGNAAAKVDFVLRGPVPWANPSVGRAGTVHVGGTRAELARAEAQIAAGRHADTPPVLLSDPAVVDPDREVGGLRPLWTYAHVPAYSTRDLTGEVIAAVERFAPGFRDVVVAARCTPAADLHEHNANYIGGDIAAGAVTLGQVIARPTLPPDPYRVRVPGIYLCSASTAPGPGVHGLCGAYAARRALRERFGIRSLPYLGV
ncbi:MAG: phytoene desaturase family protein [Actinomycetales bacterium]